MKQFKVRMALAPYVVKEMEKLNISYLYKEGQEYIQADINNGCFHRILVSAMCNKQRFESDMPELPVMTWDSICAPGTLRRLLGERTVFILNDDKKRKDNICIIRNDDNDVFPYFCSRYCNYSSMQDFAHLLNKQLLDKNCERIYVPYDMEEIKKLYKKNLLKNRDVIKKWMDSDCSNLCLVAHSEEDIAFGLKRGKDKIEFFYSVCFVLEADKKDIRPRYFVPF